VAVESPSQLRDRPEPLRLTLLAARLLAREREITDALVNLLMATVHRIGARYRSQPPSTGSIEATEAMTSASMPPMVRTGAACRLTKDGSRRCTR